MPVSTIILAAGASSRMGQPKALLKWKNKTFLENICHNLSDAGTEEIVIVTSASIDKKCRLLTTKNACPAFIINPHPEQGMLSSFRCGLRALKSSDRNVMLCLTDHPMVKIETYKLLFSVAKKNKIIIPKYKNRRGHPVIFGADFIPELLEKNCPEGARTIVHAHPEAVEEILVEDAGILLDIDTPEDAKKAGVKV
jgi:molybdenum cofactor cytidylyltransferase